MRLTQPPSGPAVALRHAISTCLLLAGCMRGSSAPTTIAVPAEASAPREAIAAPPSAARPACAVGSPDAALPPLAQLSSERLVAQYGTGVDGYRLQDGVWLAQAPLLVNEDFDFATAMGLGAIGAGLAAKQRIDHNAARSAALSATTLPGEGVAALDALRACGVHRWAIAWGGSTETLRVVTELYDRDHVRVSTSERELPGGVEQAWWVDGVAQTTPPPPP